LATDTNNTLDVIKPGNNFPKACKPISRPLPFDKNIPERMVFTLSTSSEQLCFFHWCLMGMPLQHVQQNAPIREKILSVELRQPARGIP
jgi:hypothetical protein